MLKIYQYIHGDKKLWGLILVLSILSLLPVYSASSNLEYIIGNQTANEYLIKHIFFIISGFIIMFILQNINYKYFGGFSLLTILFFIILLIFTLTQGKNIEGANASRWLKISLIPSFQTSVFANLILYIYLARQLSKFRKIIGINIIPDILICFPILCMVGLIFPANGSTAIMTFFISIIILFIGGYPFKRIFLFSFISLIFCTIFIVSLLIIPNIFKSNRLDTWKSRVKNFIGGDKVEESYQNQHAKAAIVQGGIIGKGPGKSALKQTLPQSSSDFIFAIIIEEYGYIGLFIIILIFLLILQRIIYISIHINTFFGTMLTLSVGLPIIFQAFLNMCVAVNLIPITGQTLPILSLGGSSMWSTYSSFGIIISISRNIKKPDKKLKIIFKYKKNERIYNIA